MERWARWMEDLVLVCVKGHWGTQWTNMEAFVGNTHSELSLTPPSDFILGFPIGSTYMAESKGDTHIDQFPGTEQGKKESREHLGWQMKSPSSLKWFKDKSFQRIVYCFVNK